MSFASTCTVKNKRDYMEDRHNVIRDVVPGIHLIGVYDGHAGMHVADLCFNLFPNLLPALFAEMREQGSLDSSLDHNNVLKQALRKVDAIAGDRGVGTFCGSTVCMALVQPEKNIITVANIGDSRMIMKSAGKIFALTKDHSPNHPGERARIERTGGKIFMDPRGTERVMGTLNMTRALGDRYLRPHVSPNPVISKYAYDEMDDYLVVASDGLWDVLSNQEVMRIVDSFLCEKNKRDGNMPHNVARELVNIAIARGSTDNITVIWFPLYSTNKHQTL